MLNYLHLERWASSSTSKVYVVAIVMEDVSVGNSLLHFQPNHIPVWDLSMVLEVLRCSLICSIRLYLLKWPSFWLHKRFGDLNGLWSRNIWQRLSLHPLGLKLLLYRPSPLFESEEQLQLQLHNLFPARALETYIGHSSQWHKSDQFLRALVVAAVLWFPNRDYCIGWLETEKENWKCIVCIRLDMSPGIRRKEFCF